jgi:hypothetical protein
MDGWLRMHWCLSVLILTGTYMRDSLLFDVLWDLTWTCS